MKFQSWRRIVLANALLIFSVVSTSSADLLPNNRHIFINVANDAGVKYNMDGAAYGGPNNTYYIKADAGGTNALHVTTDPTTAFGQVTSQNTDSSSPSGTLYLTDTGGRGFTDNIILMISVKGPVGDNFNVNITSSGYTWVPYPPANPPSAASSPSDPVYSYLPSALNKSFTSTDLIYGPHVFKPGPGTLGVWSLPLYLNQNTSDPNTAEYLMFIDLGLGTLYGIVPGVAGGKFSGLTDYGAVKVDFSFSNFYTNASFNLYGWCSASNQGEGISWTNATSGSGTSGFTINYTGPYGTYTIEDALKALHVTVGLETATAQETTHLDVAPLVNGVPHASGIINIQDVLMILRRVVGLPTW